MGVTRTPLIAGNWKMNLDHLQAVAFVQKLHWTLKEAKHENDSVEVAVFPPFTALADVAVIRQWAGMYDVSPDHQPLVGPTVQLDGWWQANGWSGRGMLLAPYLCELLAERLVGGVAPPRLAMFDPDRFEPATAAAVDQADYYARYAPAATAAPDRS